MGVHFSSWKLFFGLFILACSILSSPELWKTHIAYQCLLSWFKWHYPLWSHLFSSPTTPVTVVSPGFHDLHPFPHPWYPSHKSFSHAFGFSWPLYQIIPKHMSPNRSFLRFGFKPTALDCPTEYPMVTSNSASSHVSLSPDLTFLLCLISHLRLLTLISKFLESGRPDGSVG